MDSQTQLIYEIVNVEDLYNAYMPFVTGGGLFIRTHKDYELNASINLSIKLLQEVEYYKIKGKIVWITPKGAQDNKNPGIGVQFCGEHSTLLFTKIETYLAEMLHSSQVTDTM